jgi:hypothetical protein
LKSTFYFCVFFSQAIDWHSVFQSFIVVVAVAAAVVVVVDVALKESGGGLR